MKQKKTSMVGLFSALAILLSLGLGSLVPANAAEWGAADAVTPHRGVADLGHEG